MSPSPSAQHKHGALIEWRDLSFTVMDRATGQQKRILADVAGVAQPGRLLSIMGPSGAGKSTLLDVLACNTASSPGASIEGTITVDGAPRRERDFRRISCYVQQKDVLLSSATVREVVMTSALLKLPRGMALEAKRDLVEATLRELDLTSCADILIGDETIGLKGISGGQKRRVSVGVELVKDPRVLFLDEPSSGLDSEMALSVVMALMRLARRGRTVVCTIHQPNSDITDCFDDFLLLAGGRAVYGGLWSSAVDFFTRCGYSCPAYKNPTDYFMSIITRDSAAVDNLTIAYDKARDSLLERMLAEGRAAAAAPATTATEFPMAVSAAAAPGNGSGNLGSASTASLSVPQVTNVAGSGSGGAPGPHLALEVATQGWGGQGAGEAEGEAVKAVGVPMWFQVSVLSQRYWRTWVRNPIMLTSELVQYIFTAVFVGLMYYRFDDVLGQGEYNRASCIWFTFAVLCFTPSYTAVTNWASERLLLKREVGQRLYSITAYYFARYSVIMPFQMAQCLLFLSVMYFFVGFQASAGGFFTFFAVLSMFQIVSEGLGACCAVVTRTATAAIIMLTFVLLLVLAFSGFLTTKVPIYFVWVQKTSYLTYAYAALLERELSHVTLRDPTTGETVPGMQAFPEILRTGLSYSTNIGILAAQVAGMEFIKLAAFNLAYYADLL